MLHSIIVLYACNNFTTVNHEFYPFSLWITRCNTALRPWMIDNMTNDTNDSVNNITYYSFLAISSLYPDIRLFVVRGQINLAFGGLQCFCAWTSLSLCVCVCGKTIWLLMCPLQHKSSSAHENCKGTVPYLLVSEEGKEKGFWFVPPLDCTAKHMKEMSTTCLCLPKSFFLFSHCLFPTLCPFLLSSSHPLSLEWMSERSQCWRCIMTVSFKNTKALHVS